MLRGTLTPRVVSSRLQPCTSTRRSFTAQSELHELWIRGNIPGLFAETCSGSVRFFRPEPEERQMAHAEPRQLKQDPCEQNNSRNAYK
ncbi:hypothetical protein CesoFtcFv8_005862 [Champsocephalus esox]|uniref:Uncharacterized protein n=2 Tax=Champsocephalus TaxID=52236 RepID=A0AAN8DUR3_CHAGU|nr:hypothetical protein CesoFtcFv8_005862 [Champsocephalus esox]KAK5928940.1 hypothetical protein CgunFtcFv8_010218 [Champsocephalus gunnari]